jgi:hypothetical protein
MRVVPSLALVLALLGGSASAAPAIDGVQFWLGGEDPITVSDKHREAPTDFMQLFEPAAPWARASREVTAFKMSMQFATRASATDLATVVADLNRRKIALGIETGMLRNDRGCGTGEGYMSPALLTQAMKRIQQAGGRVDDVTMDEVVFFGHEKTWPDGPGQKPCRDALPEIAREVAANVALIHRYFPAARIGSVEPITTNDRLDVRQLVRDDVAFADLFREATGSPLAFFHADIAWRSKDWLPGIAPLKAAAHARGIRFGAIVGGDPDFTDDVSWTRAGLRALRSLAASPATAPDDVVVQSWQPLPTHDLPENVPGTTTWMLLQAELLMDGAPV